MTEADDERERLHAKIREIHAPTFDVAALERDAARALSPWGGIATYVEGRIEVRCRAGASADNGTEDASIWLSWTGNTDDELTLWLSGGLPMSHAMLKASPLGVRRLTLWRKRLGLPKVDGRLFIDANALGLRDGRAIGDELAAVAGDLEELALRVTLLTCRTRPLRREAALAMAPRLLELWCTVLVFRLEQPPPSKPPIVPAFDVAVLARELHAALGGRSSTDAYRIVIDDLREGERTGRVVVTWQDAGGSVFFVHVLGDLRHAAARLDADVAPATTSRLFAQLFSPKPARRDRESALEALRVEGDAGGLEEAQRLAGPVGAVLPWVSTIDWRETHFDGFAPTVHRDDVTEAAGKLVDLWRALVAVRA